MKIVIVTAVWKRPNVFALFAKGVHHLQAHAAKSGYQVKVAISGSEGRTSEKMVKSQGFNYVERPNQPLARKMNAALKEARKMDPDYVLLVGSDTVIHPSLFDVYDEYIQQGIDLIAALDWYFYDLRTLRCSYWGGYIDSRAGHPCGCGRVVSRELLDKWDWKIWEDRHSFGLDNSMQLLINKGNFTYATFKMKERQAFGIEIKSEVNMTPFQLWPNTSLIENQKLMSNFKYLLK